MARSVVPPGEVTRSRRVPGGSLLSNAMRAAPSAVCRVNRWAVSAGRPLLPSGPQHGPAEPAITSPRDGALFSVSPDVPAHLQLVEVKMALPAGASSASLVVDGETAAISTGPPWIVDWVLEPGEHLLAVRAGGATSDPITVFVD